MQGIVSDLHEAGYVTRTASGGPTATASTPSATSPAESDMPVCVLLDMFADRDHEA
ncbi:hypothetical protein ABT061_34980 [Streptosporangium sp. NPDC002544]|uniref:hypothetical protein n=1 Tax=Streptosporangium sp. NPDC002544 TaxID=3154538 RepID=UPI003325BD06